MTDLCRCSICHREYPSKDLLTFGGETLCLFCMAQNTRTCYKCGQYIWKERAFIFGGAVFCPKCAMTVKSSF